MLDQSNRKTYSMDELYTNPELQKYVFGTALYYLTHKHENGSFHIDADTWKSLENLPFTFTLDWKNEGGMTITARNDIKDKC